MTAQTIKTFLKDNLLGIIGAVTGAAGGAVYYATIGCSSGSCPITSNPWLTTLWGGVMGYLIASMFKQTNKNKS